ncbi:MAG: transcriptional regulator [Kiloniellales bacterium]|nr:transcriptional regulator [Kiloniellales bacterium]
MDIRPIKTKADYENALARVEELMDAMPDTPEGDELDVLATLVEKYEDENFPIEAPDPIEAIKFRMEQGGFRQGDLANVLGLRSRASEILSGKRRLTLEMIRRLHDQWHIPVEVLIQQTRTKKASSTASASKAKKTARAARRMHRRLKRRSRGPAPTPGD